MKAHIESELVFANVSCCCQEALALDIKLYTVRGNTILLSVVPRWHDGKHNRMFDVLKIYINVRQTLHIKQLNTGRVCCVLFQCVTPSG